MLLGACFMSVRASPPFGASSTTLLPACLWECNMFRSRNTHCDSRSLPPASPSSVMVYGGKNRACGVSRRARSKRWSVWSDAASSTADRTQHWNETILVFSFILSPHSSRQRRPNAGPWSPDPSRPHPKRSSRIAGRSKIEGTCTRVDPRNATAPRHPHTCSCALPDTAHA